MESERKGGWGWLVAISLAVIGVAVGIFLYRSSAPRYGELLVFHWIPSSAPLQVLGTPPFCNAPGDNIEHTLPWTLREMLRDAGVGGELRQVASFPLREDETLRTGAILLRNPPTAPFTLGLVDVETAIFGEMPASGFVTYPLHSPSSGATLTLKPGKNAQVQLLEFSLTTPGRGTSTGALGLWWW